MHTIVSKFGGTSVSSKITWDNIVKISKNHIQNGLKPILVCSARSQASNILEQLIQQALLNNFTDLEHECIQLHHNLCLDLDVDPVIISAELDALHQWLTGIALLKHIPAKTHAQILSLGEIMSTKIGQIYLEKSGLNCLWYDARLAIHTQDHSQDEFINYCEARCHPKPNQMLQHEFTNTPHNVIITQGFIGSNRKDETVLLGRGGSDTSAALFAAILDAKECEIWTDVPGMYTANPHQLPQARLLKRLNYDEAQEIASQGAKVLHPLAIAPVRQAEIPMSIKYTWKPEHPGTLITLDSDLDAPPVKSIQIKSSISLISLESSGMWQHSGFLAQVFSIFAKYQLSINLISTAECHVTLSLDGQHPRAKLEQLLNELNEITKAKLIEPCSAISLIGHHIRRILPELGPTFELFNDLQVHLISLSSNDLSLNIVVDESKAERIMQQLHQLLIDNNPQSYYYSKSWQEEFNPAPEAPSTWWQKERDALLTFASKHAPCYVYYPPLIQTQIEKVLSLSSIDKLLYAVKANPNTALLKLMHAANLSFECVSIGEVKRLFELFPEIDPKRILFTPNFAHREEYEYALEKAVYLTVDSLYPLVQWGELFIQKDIFLRLDLGIGAGHRKYVSTSGDESKFGITLHELDEVLAQINKYHIKVIGLHAHSGSGILSAQLWIETADLLSSLIKYFPDANIFNLGGGLGIAERPGQLALNLQDINEQLLALKSNLKKPIEFWLEPGRYLVAEAGVILARATQEKMKNRVRFVGIDIGMNSLIRPALYGSYHHICNLTRLDEPHKSFAHVVGPICESADTLGYDRMLPLTQEKDIFLIANTGAYGYCMASSYNLREPAPEYIFQGL